MAKRKHKPAAKRGRAPARIVKAPKSKKRALAKRKPAKRAALKTNLTGSQTVGPFFRFGLVRPELERLWRPGVLGTHIRLVGRVTDGKGTPVPDAMIEIWQADADGHYAHPADQRAGKRERVFLGFGRSGTDADGMFHFDTIKPGPVPGRGNSTQAPHLEVSVFARGLLDRLITRVYFPDEPLNDQDPLLGSIKDKAVRRTLIARLDGDAAETNSMPTYVFDIRLQGEGETAFFDA
jgi:protocatechuate 3,4-dioxygenase alpha subunit